eukprot:5742536-Alexandrium_andersonii.AAC.1
MLAADAQLKWAGPAPNTHNERKHIACSAPRSEALIACAKDHDLRTLGDGALNAARLAKSLLT